MKRLFIAAMLLSIPTFADCATSFNSGVNDYNFAVTYYNTGVEEYNNAVEEASKPTPNYEIVCRGLLNSYAGFLLQKILIKDVETTLPKVLNRAQATTSSSQWSIAIFVLNQTRLLLGI